MPWKDELDAFRIAGLPLLNETVWLDRASGTLIASAKGFRLAAGGLTTLSAVSARLSHVAGLLRKSGPQERADCCPDANKAPLQRLMSEAAPRQTEGGALQSFHAARDLLGQWTPPAQPSSPVTPARAPRRATRKKKHVHLVSILGVFIDA
jgi:hypothetical protein